MIENTAEPVNSCRSLFHFDCYFGFNEVWEPSMADKEKDTCFNELLIRQYVLKVMTNIM